MAITSVITDMRGASGRGSGTNPSLGTTQISVKHIVQSSDPLDQPNIIFNHFRTNASLPWYGRSYRYGNDVNNDLICVGVAVEKMANSYAVWEVTSEYESRAISGLPAGQATSSLPGSEFPPVRVETASTTITIPVEQARYHSGMKDEAHKKRLEMNNQGPKLVGEQNVGFQFGGPVVNSAFVPFDPPLEMDLDIDITRITAAYPSWDGDRWRRLRGKVNKTEINPRHRALKFSDRWKATKARIALITGRPAYGTRGTLYWDITFEFWLNILSWRDFVVDRGLVKRAWQGDDNGRGGTYSSTDYEDGMARVEPIRGPDGLTAVSEPVLLNGKGQPYKESQVQVPIFLEYSKYQEVDFNPLLQELGRK